VREQSPGYQGRKPPVPCDPSHEEAKTEQSGVTWMKVTAEGEAMLDAMLSIGGWALVCALIYFSGRWAEQEREFFSHGDVSWGRLE
jgi:hypothetical protein